MTDAIKTGLATIIDMVTNTLQESNDDSWIDWTSYFSDEEYKAYVDAQVKEEAERTSPIWEAIDYLRQLI